MPDLTVIQPTAATPLQTLVDDYLAHCRARGLAPNTVKQAYRYPLQGILLPWCAEQGITEVSQLTPRVLDRLSRHLIDDGGAKGAPLSSHSVHAYMRAINHCLAWAAKEGEEVKGKASLPRLPKRLVEVLTREEIRRMEETAKTERDKLIIRLLADTGLRVDELLSLRVGDLVEQSRSNHFLHIRGKGSKDRMVPIPRLYRRLRIYAERSRAHDTVSARIFLSHRKSPNGDYQPLTRSGLLQMIKNIAEEAGIDKRVYPHLLRHSFATWQLANGMNPIQLAQIMGHSSLTMIQEVYSHLSPNDAYNALVKVLQQEEGLRP